jgi:hypothetical protein
MVVVDLFREKLALCECNLAYDRIVGLADSFAHVGRFEDRTILVEQSLVVSKVVRVHCVDLVSFLAFNFCRPHSRTFEVVAHPRKPFRSWHITNGMTIDRDSYWGIRSRNSLQL